MGKNYGLKSVVHKVIGSDARGLGRSRGRDQASSRRTTKDRSISVTDLCNWIEKKRINTKTKQEVEAEVKEEP